MIAAAALELGAGYAVSPRVTYDCRVRDGFIRESGPLGALAARAAAVRHFRMPIAAQLRRAMAGAVS